MLDIVQLTAPLRTRPPGVISYGSDSNLIDLVDEVSRVLATGDSLSRRLDSDRLIVTYHTERYLLPAQFSKTSVYSLLGTLAVILNSEYLFLLRKDTLEAKTHAISVINKMLLETLSIEDRSRLMRYFVDLELGRNYFNGRPEVYQPIKSASESAVDPAVASNELGNSLGESLTSALASKSLEGAIKKSARHVGKSVVFVLIKRLLQSRVFSYAAVLVLMLVAALFWLSNR